MSRSDRLFRLLHLLRILPAPVTAHRLAQEIEISLRSVYRDIDTLRASGVIIDGERGYGYRLIEDYSLPPKTFDRMELEALVLGLSEVTHMGDPHLKQAALSALSKIKAIIPTDSERFLFHAVSLVYRPEERFQDLSFDINTLRQACWQEKALKIWYSDTNDQSTQREIFPLSIVYREKNLIVLSWCCWRQDFRMFRLDRIEKVISLEKSFRPQRAVLLRTYLRNLRQSGTGSSQYNKG